MTPKERRDNSQPSPGFCYLDKQEKLKLKTKNYYKRDVVIIKLKKKFKDTVPICVKKHTKIEAELLHNKEPIYMSGQLEQLPVF